MPHSAAKNTQQRQQIFSTGRHSVSEKLAPFNKYKRQHKPALADRVVRSMISYWHHNVILLAVRVAKRQVDKQFGHRVAARAGKNLGFSEKVFRF